MKLSQNKIKTLVCLFIHFPKLRIHQGRFDEDLHLLKLKLNWIKNNTQRSCFKAKSNSSVWACLGSHPVSWWHTVPPQEVGLKKSLAFLHVTGCKSEKWNSSGNPSSSSPLLYHLSLNKVLNLELDDSLSTSSFHGGACRSRAEGAEQLMFPITNNIKKTSLQATTRKSDKEMHARAHTRVNKSSRAPDLWLRRTNRSMQQISLKERMISAGKTVRFT